MNRLRKEVNWVSVQMWGSDPDAVGQLAGEFQREGDAVAGLAQRSAGLISASADFWRGPDADSFRQRWEDTHLPRLRAIAVALDEHARRARAEETQQRQTSGGY